jgi:hypothetical protein
MATLGTTAFVAYLGLRGDGKEKTTPPIQASSGDEEKFIRCVSHCHTALLGSNAPCPYSALALERCMAGGQGVVWRLA